MGVAKGEDNGETRSTATTGFETVVTAGSPGAVHDAVQAVGNGEDSTVGKLLADGGLNQVVRLQVDGGCGLVQDQYARFPQQSSGETQQLSLPNTVERARTSLTHIRSAKREETNNI